MEIAARRRQGAEKNWVRRGVASASLHLCGERSGMKHKVKNIHFVGVGGSGMSGIAEVLANLGYQVSGSRPGGQRHPRRLEAPGRQGACRPCRKTRRQGRRRRRVDRRPRPTILRSSRPISAMCRWFPGPQMLAELMRLKRGIAIAGTSSRIPPPPAVAASSPKAHRPQLRHWRPLERRRPA